MKAKSSTDQNTIPLEDAAEIGSGLTKGRKQVNGTFENVPYMRVANVQDGFLDLSEIKTIPANAAERQRYALRVGDLLMTEGGDPDKLGRAALWRGEVQGCLHQNHVFRVRAKCTTFLPQYLAAVMGSSYGKAYFLKVAKRTTGIASINRTQLGAFPVPVRSLGEQRRIVDLLERAAGIRRLREQALAKARAIVPALFLDMFGDSATNPKGWPVVTLAEMGTLDRGRSRHRPRNDPRLLGGPYPFIQTGDVANSKGMIEHYTSTYSEIGLQQSRMWPKGTLCITIAANIAATGILTFDACFPDSVVGFLPAPNVRSEYVQAVIDHARAILEQNAPQAAQRNINLRILSELPTPLPPVVLQEMFAGRLADLRAIIAQQQRSLTAARELERSLMARLLG